MDLTPGIFPRKVVWGLFDTPIGKINFFNTHLSYYSAWVNEKEIDEILNFAGAKMAIQSNNNAIITGDFNAPPDTPSYLKMINGNYTDSYLFINPNSNGYTASYPGTSIRIDYIFMNSSSDLIIDDSYLIMKQPISQNFYCSDHLGIMPTFSNPTFVDIEEETEIPMNFSLSQNYPNPFNPTTTIKYTVPFVQTHRNASVHTTLKVYNNLGNEVATLVTEFQLPGEQVVEFNVETLHATSLQSGIYFYQLTVGDKTLTKKMLLLK